MTDTYPKWESGVPAYSGNADRWLSTSGQGGQGAPLAPPTPAPSAAPPASGPLPPAGPSWRSIPACGVLASRCAGTVLPERSSPAEREGAKIRSRASARLHAPLGYLRNLLVVLSASILPPVWHVGQ